jgi:hypothetical protein
MTGGKGQIEGKTEDPEEAMGGVKMLHPCTGQEEFARTGLYFFLLRSYILSSKIGKKNIQSLQVLFISLNGVNFEFAMRTVQGGSDISRTLSNPHCRIKNHIFY